MRITGKTRARSLAIGAVFWMSAYSQTTPTPETPARAEQRPSIEAKGVPPRAAPTDYQAVALAGPLTIAAEFAGHSIPTPDGTYSSEDAVVVEVAVFGPPGTHAQLSSSDFSLRINGKKQ